MIKENETISKTLLTIDKYKGNLISFKNAIIDGDYTPNNENFKRTLIWKTCLITESLKISVWESKLNDSRVVFHQLLSRDDLKLPWYKLDADHLYYQNQSLSRKSSITRKHQPSLKKKLPKVNVNSDPLRYTNTINDLELLEIIILDIERLFPGEEFFKSLYVKKQLIEILYIWCKCNKFGYKQGIHEILGLIYMNLQKESIEISSTNTFSSDDLKILKLFDLNYLCHDVFTIFNKVMNSSGILKNFYESEENLMSSIEKFNMYLMKVDQFIYYNLHTKLKLESQLWIIRYLRLLLLRELGNDFKTINLLWDKLITNISSISELINFIIIHLLIQIKTDLLSSDFSECLSLLLHYPIKFKPNDRNVFTKNLFKDSFKLYEKRSDDLKLYEYGIKLNQKYNSNLKISMSYTPRSSQEGTPPPPPPPLNSYEKSKFEKTKLEMRLKKKTQSMIKP
ncbi:unnamed protein product [Candida verbasci]|uniref:Oxidant-induced cell-cycle arrest protein 5 n=1 Tax=Candida verbasci TaxID=1227364 RepID=A0A9W4XB69_9ASCO|nr:unnamed protein product [Candida verbasci]